MLSDIKTANLPFFPHFLMKSKIIYLFRVAKIKKKSSKIAMKAKNGEVRFSR